MQVGTSVVKGQGAAVWCPARVPREIGIPIGRDGLAPEFDALRILLATRGLGLARRDRYSHLNPGARP